MTDRLRKIVEAATEIECSSILVETSITRAMLEVADAARLLHQTLADGFIRCQTCGDQESTADIDFLSDLTAALAAFDALERERSGT